MKKILLLALCCLIFNPPLFASLSEDQILKKIDDYNVKWDELGKDSLDSMPLGNGDIGLNVWTEQNGNVVFFIGKTDAFSENNRILKLGRVRLNFQPNIFKEKGVKQILKLTDSRILIESEDNEDKLFIWVDAHRPVIHVEGNFDREIKVTSKLEVWRTEKRPFNLHDGANEGFSNWTLNGFNEKMAGKPRLIYPDTVVDSLESEVMWYHRNEVSMWDVGMKLQGFADVMDKFHDPLINRTFGALIKGDNFVSEDKFTIKTKNGVKNCHLRIYSLTKQTETIAGWKKSLYELAKRVDSVDIKQAKKEHKQWWHDFWTRSYIFLEGNENAEIVTRGYILQRYINAAGGRGNYPIKFNGSIFTVKPSNYTNGEGMNKWLNDHQPDPDFRNWGGDYWWQNTRLPYWSMLASGDFDLMKPLFKMYLDTIPLAEKRAELWHDVGGHYMIETMTSWGLYSYGDYGWNMEDPIHQPANPYVSNYWQGGLELSLMMLDYHSHTGDERFFRNSALPWIKGVLKFYSEYYKKDENGKLRLDPSRVLETYFEAVNPATDVAGLQKVTSCLLALDDDLYPSDYRKFFRELNESIPDLPKRKVGDTTIIAPAEEYGKRSNMENGELYPVFPYRLHTVVSGDLKLAQNTYRRRIQKGTGGWFQDSIMAAMVGNTEEARKYLVKNFSTKCPMCKFPAFWGPNYDWVPDQDHGTVSMIALQKMLLQADKDKIKLFPAWPTHWNAKFKLHTLDKTVIEAEYKNGKIDIKQVAPSERKKDISNQNNF